MKDPELSVTVIAAVPIVPARYGRPALVDPFDVSHELRMAKSALLYADHVSLASWRVSLMKTWGEIASARDTGDAAEVMRLFIATEWARPGRGTAAAVARLERLVGEGALSSLHDAERVVGPALEGGIEALNRAWQQSSWRELLRAEAEGLLDIRTMGRVSGFGFSREAAIAEFLALIAQHTAPGSSEVPMLDYSSAGVLEVGTDVGLLKDPLPIRSKEISLADHYIGYIPAVGDAGLDEIVRARQELKGPLVRFRALLGELAEVVEKTPAGADFATSANDLFAREMAPDLERLRALSRDRGLGRLLGAEVTEARAGAVTSAVIGLAAAGIAGLPPPVQAGVGAAALAADVVGGVVKRWREVGRQQSENALFWIYEVDRRVSSRVLASST